MQLHVNQMSTKTLTTQSSTLQTCQIGQGIVFIKHALAHLDAAPLVFKQGALLLHYLRHHLPVHPVQLLLLFFLKQLLINLCGGVHLLAVHQAGGPCKGRHDPTQRPPLTFGQFSLSQHPHSLQLEAVQTRYGTVVCLCCVSRLLKW